MTTGEFADLVGKMRRAQIVAGKIKTPEAYLEAMGLEREVDAVLLDRIKRMQEKSKPMELDFEKEQEDDHTTANKTLPSGRDSAKQGSPSNEKIGNEQQGTRWAQQPSEDRLKQLDIW